MANVAHGSPPQEFRAPPRIRDSRGGYSPVLTRYDVTPGMANELARFPGTTNDTMIRRDRTAWYQNQTLRGAASGWVNWTAAGPTRPELNMRNVNLRTMQGTSRTRALANPIDPTVGLHSDPKVPAIGTISRFTNANNPRMRKPRQDRIQPGQYNGQSYSSTTMLQGGSGQ